MAPGTVQLSIFSWNAILAKYVKQKGIVLNSLFALEEGKKIHSQVVESGCESDVYLGKDAWNVFDRMPTRDVVTWNAMIRGYAKCGQGWEALKLFRQMQDEGMQLDSVTFMGKHVHKQIIEGGLEGDVFLGSSLVDIVFNKMHTCDVVAWSAMILGYLKCGQGQKALEIYQQIVMSLEEGRRIHEQIKHSLVDMYAKCGNIEDAWKLFNSMATHDVVSWNAMILGFWEGGRPIHTQVVQSGCESDNFDAQRVFEMMPTHDVVSSNAMILDYMHLEGVDPDHVAFVMVVNACASIMALNEGRHIHEQIVQNGFESDVIVGNSLVDMYAKCGNMETAQSVFQRMPTHNVFAWNAMILGYFKCGQGKIALEVYQQMQQEGVQPDSVTFVGVLNACASVMALEEGRHIHERIIQSGYESDAFVRKSLKDMYAKCGSIHNVHKLSNRMPK
ncbi:hypothetical protein BDL97_14G098100 [Sphagnum fallax]|nr:hypothetical protein BDL97_14G098100 [Sphagnum fallax]